jgi:AcrR family transcriptional regulator
MALNRKKKAVATRLALGEHITDIAESTGISRTAIHRWLREDEELQEFMQEEQHRLFDEARRAVQGLLGKASEGIQAILDDYNHKDHFKACTWVLEKGIPDLGMERHEITQAQPPEVKIHVHFTEENRPDEV